MIGAHFVKEVDLCGIAFYSVNYRNLGDNVSGLTTPVDQNDICGYT